MRKYKKQINPSFIEIIPSEDPQQVNCAARAAINRLLALNPPVEGIVFMSNTIGLPALGHLHAKGVKIPEKLKVVSMDATPYFSLMHPSISAMNLNIEDMSEKIFGFLMKLIREEEMPSRTVIETIPVSLIVRESSAPNC
jgi:DNA-binding LacI/PurR family transcriptional regulator